MSDATEMRWDVFLSYSSADRDVAERLEELLEEAGFSVWWDRELPIGTTYEDRILPALAASHTVVVLWSKTAAESDWVKSEALDGKKRKCLLPVLLEAGLRLPPDFQFLTAGDFTRWDRSPEHLEFRRLAGAIRERLPRGRTATGVMPQAGTQKPPSRPLSGTNLREKLDKLQREIEENPGEEASKTWLARLQRVATRIWRDPRVRAGEGGSLIERLENLWSRARQHQPPPAAVGELRLLARYLGWCTGVPSALLGLLYLGTLLVN